jgi:hypothetical protein
LRRCQRQRSGLLFCPTHRWVGVSLLAAVVVTGIPTAKFYFDWTTGGGDAANRLLAERYEDLAKRLGISEQALDHLFRGLNRGEVPAGALEAEVAKIVQEFEEKDRDLARMRTALIAMTTELRQKGQPIPSMVAAWEAELKAAEASLRQGDLDKAAVGLEVVREAAARGNFGLRVCPVIGRPVYVESDHPQDERRYFARFQLRPAEVNASAGGSSALFLGLDKLGQELFRVTLLRGAPDLLVNLTLPSTAPTSPLRVPATWSTLELDWQMTDADRGITGTLRINGLEARATGRLAAPSKGVDAVRLGAPIGETRNLGGCYFVDEFESYRGRPEAATG